MTTKRNSIESYLENRISFNELADEIGGEDAEAIQATKQMLKREKR